MSPAGSVLVEVGSGYDYGNARLRARAGLLLDRAAYDRLLGLDLPQLLAALAGSPYGPDLREALPRAAELAAVQLAVGRHLTRSLREARGFYGGRAGRVLDALLRRWDALNVVRLLRGKAAGLAGDDILPLLVPVGALDEPAAAEAARGEGVRPAIELLARWGVPNPHMALAALGAVPAFEESGEIGPVEDAVVAGWGEGLNDDLDGTGRDRTTVEPILREEMDRRNALLVLRIRPATGATPTRFLPGGAVPQDVFAAAAAAPDRSEAARVLGAPQACARWRPALSGWAETGDLPALQRELEAAHARRAIDLLRTGDPLGPAVPTAFVFAAENEARNLRIVAYGAAVGAAPALIRAQILAPW